MRRRSALDKLSRRGHARQGPDDLDPVVGYRNASDSDAPAALRWPLRPAGPRAPLVLGPFPLGAPWTAPLEQPTLSRSLTIVATGRRFIDLCSLREHSYMARLQLN